MRDRIVKQYLGLRIALLMACSLPGHIFASSPLEIGKHIYLKGNDKGAAACMACHGMAGEGQAAVPYPRVAGMNHAYLVKQMQDFKSGARENPVMHAIASALSADEMKNVAVYMESLKPVAITSESDHHPKLPLGEEIANQGLWDKGIPACFACHGARGNGIGASFPGISNQHPKYLLQEIQSWKKGTRKNDPQGLMKTIALKLSDEEAEAVAAYLSSRKTSSKGSVVSPSAQTGGTPSSAKSQTEFVPPHESEIPDNEYGRMIRLGRNAFVHTSDYAKPYVGNALQCVNCHLDRGRKPDSAPLWGAYGLYPAFRQKTHRVDTFQDRIAGCFQYSMNGKAPPSDSKLMTALVTYSQWLAHGTPTGEKLKGQGYPALAKPARTPNWNAGEKVFKDNCAICHGAKGEGQLAEGRYVFPPLWGTKSYNWGAGMHKIDVAAAFIKANMPLGLQNTLSDQDAWDVAYFINAHERPKDRRSKNNIKAADKEFHDENCLYGEEIHGHLLGSGPKK